MSILDTVMMEEDESLRTKQICIMQESMDKLLQGCRSEQDLQEKITTLTTEWDVAINNAAVNLCQYENLQKDNIKLPEEFNKLKKFQGSGEINHPETQIADQGKRWYHHSAETRDQWYLCSMR